MDRNPVTRGSGGDEGLKNQGLGIRVMVVKSYRDLIVWQKSISLVKNVYVLSESLPKEELYE